MIKLVENITDREWEDYEYGFIKNSMLDAEDRKYLQYAEDILDGHPMTINGTKLSKDAPFLGISFEDKIVGYIWIINDNLFGDTEIYYMWIQPEYRKKGIGREVLQLAMQYVTQNDVMIGTETEGMKALMNKVGSDLQYIQWSSTFARFYKKDLLKKEIV